MRDTYLARVKNGLVDLDLLGLVGVLPVHDLRCRRHSALRPPVLSLGIVSELTYRIIEKDIQGMAPVLF